MALNLLRDCKDIKGEEEKKEGCVKHRKDHQKFTFCTKQFAFYV